MFGVFCVDCHAIYCNKCNKFVEQQKRTITWWWNSSRLHLPVWYPTLGIYNGLELVYVLLFIDSAFPFKLLSLNFSQIFYCYGIFNSYSKQPHFHVHKNPTDATVCRYLFTAKLLYMFRVSQQPSSGVLKTVPAASDQTTLEGSSGTSSMTYTGGCGSSF